VIFIPNFISPFKVGSGTSDIVHRIEMINLSIKDNPNFELSEFEAEKKRAVYTYETIEYYMSIMPDKEFYLILGNDSFVNITQWKNSEYILKNSRIIVVGRPLEVSGKIKELPEHIVSVSTPLMDISSTVIRKMTTDNLDIKYLVNDEVSLYIREKKLYK